MDRELTKDEIAGARRRTLTIIGAVAGMVVITIALIFIFLRPSVKERDLIMRTADTGDVAWSVNAPGKVVPGSEMIITSPIASRVMEVYRNAGERVDSGTPLLRLDLGATEAETGRLRDTYNQQQLAVEQQRLADVTDIENLEMEISVKEMNVERLEATLTNERRLDEIGSGTGDRVREAELAYRTAVIQLEQLRRRLANERQMRASAQHAKELDLAISARNLSEQEHTLEQARLKSPRSGVITYITATPGVQVAAGEKVASVADFGVFEIEAEISESNAPYVTTGGDARIRIGRRQYPAVIGRVSPLSHNGAISFKVLFTDSVPDGLRPGVAADVFVIRGVRENVVRIPIGAYYTSGPGNYDMFVRHGDKVERRKVQLGEAGSDYVEVISGLDAGESVATANTAQYSRNVYKLK